MPASAPVPDKVKAGVSGLGEIEAHNLAEPGDVLVVQGVDQVSNLGGMSATIGRRQGEIGAIVDGGARDVDHSRAIGLPVWSRSVSPITGKWRVETVAVNQPMTICGVAVHPRRSRCGGRNRSLLHPARARGTGAGPGAAQCGRGKAAGRENRVRRADFRAPAEEEIRVAVTLRRPRPSRFGLLALSG